MSHLAFMEITFGSIVSYLIGIPLSLLGLLLLIETPLGLVPLLAGILLIPIIRRQISDRAGVDFSRGAIAGIGTIGIIAGLIVLVTVALSGGGGEAPPGSDVSNMSVTAADGSPPEADTSLEVEWNFRAQSAVDPDPDDFSIYNANEGQKFLVVRMRITNEGDEEIELTPRLFRLESEGVQYEHQGLFGAGNSFSGVTLNPGASYSAWTVFSVPEDATAGELIVYQDAYFQKTVAVTFNHEPGMAIDMSD